MVDLGRKSSDVEVEPEFYEKEDEVDITAPWYLLGVRELSIVDFDLSEDDMSTQTAEIPVRTIKWEAKKREASPEGRADYWHINKMLRFVKCGDQCGTTTALACLEEFDYKLKPNRMVLLEANGLEVLINLLETDDLRCQLGSMRILVQLAEDVHFRKFMISYGIVPVILCLTSDPSTDLQRLAITTLYHLSKEKKVRSIVRKCDAIGNIMDLVDVDEELLTKASDQHEPFQEDMFKVAMYAVMSLWEVAKSPRIRIIIYHGGILQLLPKLVRAAEPDVTLAAFGIIMLCASIAKFRDEMERMNLLGPVIKSMCSKISQREELGVRTLYKCSTSAESREQIYKIGALPPLVAFIKDEANDKNKPLITYATGTLWRCTVHEPCFDFMNESNLIPSLLRLLKHSEITVVTNSSGILSRLTEIQKNVTLVSKQNGINIVVDVLKSIMAMTLWANLAKVVCNCAKVKEIGEILVAMDGIRMMWSLLRAPAPSVRANAAWALIPLLRNGKVRSEAEELIRSFVGGFDVLMELLIEEEPEVQAAACAAIAEVSRDSENLFVLTELGIVRELSIQSAKTKDDLVREQICYAVASCATTAKNRFEFGRKGCIAPIVAYLASPNIRVVSSAAFALWKLSAEPVNTIILHRSGVVPFLMECTESRNIQLQMAAAGTLTNIRAVAHEADQVKYLGEVLSEGIRLSYRSKSVMQAQEKLRRPPNQDVEDV